MSDDVIDQKEEVSAFDIGDLLEYDEFDGSDTDIDACAYANVVHNESPGVPLSIELNESMCQERLGHDGQIVTAVPTDCGYLKGAEIFLRIDSNDDGGTASTNTTTTITTAGSGKQRSTSSLNSINTSSISNSNKLSIESRTISDGPSTSSGQYSLSLDGGADELQYENEFDDGDEEDDARDGCGQSASASPSIGCGSQRRHRSGGGQHYLHRRPAVENDNEQLLFEGILYR